jgi:hypothetical protein
MQPSSRFISSIRIAPRLARSFTPDGSPGACSGLHFKQGLKPASSAAAALGKNEQFFRAGLLARQVGLQ